MSVSRRTFVGSAAALSLLGTLLAPEAVQALQQAQQEPTEPLPPHDSPGFWGGFYDSANPQSPGYQQAGASRNSDSLVHPSLETQYLHFRPTDQKLRYAYSIPKSELLDHDGDIAVSILLNQYHPSAEDSKHKIGSQLRVDTVQNHPFMNILAPLAWTAIASLEPTKAGKIPPLDQLGFKSDQVMSSSSHILLTKGSGKIAVNISQAPRSSAFLKVIGTMISHANLIAPFFVLPAVSVPAMSAFSEAFSYWEDRTQFLLNGNLTNAYATQQAMDDPNIKSPTIGLLAGDYVMIAKKDTDAIEAAMPHLNLTQGYLLHKEIDLTQSSLENALKDPRNPDITYATVKVGVTPITGSAATPAKPAAADDDTPSPAPAKKKSKK